MAQSSRIHVTALLASPRPDGNSRILLDRALGSLRAQAGHDGTMETFTVTDLHISHCLGCDQCSTTGTCVQRDDMDMVQAALERSDLVVVASPVYFSGPPGPLKQLIDRCQNIWAARTLLGRRHPRRASRRALVLLTAARTKGRIFETTEEILKVWLHILDIPIHRTVTCPGVDEPGQAASQTAVLESIDEVTGALVEEILTAR